MKKLPEILAYLSLFLIVFFILVNGFKEAKNRAEKRPIFETTASKKHSKPVVVLDNDGKIVHVYEQEIDGKTYYLFFYENSSLRIEKSK
jgi:hypothetical protein